MATIGKESPHNKSQLNLLEVVWTLKMGLLLFLYRLVLVCF